MSAVISNIRNIFCYDPSSSCIDVFVKDFLGTKILKKSRCNDYVVLLSENHSSSVG